MATAGLPTQPFATAQTRGLAFFRNAMAATGLPTGLKNFLGMCARSVALNVWSLQKSIEDLDLDIVPSLQSTFNALANWAFTVGLTNGGGSYGPLLPTTASGGAALLTGVQGTSYPNGTVATGPDGTTQIKLSTGGGNLVIPGSPPNTGSVAASFVAVTTGTAGNIPANSVCTWNAPPAGADPTFVLTTGLSNALDTETGAGIMSRLLPRMQNPPNGGTSTDIQKWAQSVAGIIGVFVFPRRSGTGSIDVVVTVGGSGQSRVPSLSLIALVQAAFDLYRVPGSEQINAMQPNMPNGRGHLIQIRVAPTSSNAMDWGADSPGTAYVVDAGGYAAGPPATLRLTGLAPQSLKTAINNYIAGTATKPRLQVLSTGSVINLPINVVAFADGGGKTTLTLDTVPSGWTAPSNGDTVYPYGPVVATIAAGALALVDALGPSRASGYGDNILPWNDTLFVNQLTRVAEDAVDTNGNLLIVNVIAAGALIDGVGTDVVGTDNTPNNPEMLYATHVAVTQ